MSKEFIWTDELVQQFAKEWKALSGRISIDIFKQSNTPKPKEYKSWAFCETCDSNTFCSFSGVCKKEPTPKEQPPQRIEVSHFRKIPVRDNKSSSMGFGQSHEYSFNVWNAEIPEEKIEAIKQAIEQVLNDDKDDELVGLLRDCVSETWGNGSLTQTQELFDRFLVKRKLVNPLTRLNKFITEQVNEILLDKKYTQQQVDELCEEAKAQGKVELINGIVSWSNSQNSKQ